MHRKSQHILAVADQADPFTTRQGQAFVHVLDPATRGYYCLPVRSAGFRDWFTSNYLDRTGALPTSGDLRAAVHYLESKAADYADTRGAELNRRVASASSDGATHIFLDLANADREYVDISASGWEVTAGAGPFFQTSRSSLALSTPAPSEEPPAQALELLRACLNLPGRDEWLRCLAWLLAAFHSHGPFPILILQGPAGSGKSFAARVLRCLVDPDAVPLSAPPATVRELVSVARRRWAVVLDGVSALTPPVASALASLSTGLGLSVREDLSPSREPEPLEQFYQRPVILTVTERFVCPPELASRALTVTLPAIDPAACRPQSELAALVEEHHGPLIAALCSVVSAALRESAARSQPAPAGRLPETQSWMIAAAPALGCTQEEIRRVFDAAPAHHPIVAAVSTLLDQRSRWTGSASSLLELLQPALACQTPKGVSQELKKCALTLYDSGIELTFRRLHGGLRVIDLNRVSDAPSADASPDASPAPAPLPQPAANQELAPPSPARASAPDASPAPPLPALAAAREPIPFPAPPSAPEPAALAKCLPFPAPPPHPDSAPSVLTEAVPFPPVDSPHRPAPPPGAPDPALAPPPPHSAGESFVHRSNPENPEPEPCPAPA